MNLLFVCSENRLRSPTAERVFADYPGVSAIGAGTNSDAATPVSGDLIDWADLILVMERTHRANVAQRFREQLRGKRVIVLGIPDTFELMQPELVTLLKARVGKHLRATG